MILNSSQSIQSSTPLDTSSASRVNNISRASTTQDEKRAEQQEKQQNDRMLQKLRARDREVRAHEAAHVAAGGSLVRSGPSYTYQTGPDGRSYAIGGEVQLDVSPVPNDPEASLSKADQVRRAALAPAKPSPQDMRVAASANQMAARARIDIAIERREEAQQAQEEALESLQESQDTAAQQSSDDNADLAVPVVESATSTSAPSANLQSNEPPAAALSSFMATAQSETAPVLLNQFA